MWFALMVIGIWGFGTLGVYISKDSEIYGAIMVTTIALGIGYLIWKMCKLEAK